jgi:hypothetical protein
MTNPNDFNLPEFDLEVYEIASDLELPDALEIAVKVAEQDSSGFIPIDDCDLTQ